MDSITFDPAKPLENRVDDLEAAIATVVGAINSLTTEVTGDIDAIEGRLETAERTIGAISDALKTVSPETAEGASAAIAEIRAAVNRFFIKVYGPADTDIPFPEPPVSDVPE